MEKRKQTIFFEGLIFYQRFVSFRKLFLLFTVCIISTLSLTAGTFQVLQNNSTWVTVSLPINDVPVADQGKYNTANYTQFRLIGAFMHDDMKKIHALMKDNPNGDGKNLYITQIDLSQFTIGDPNNSDWSPSNVSVVGGFRYFCSRYNALTNIIMPNTKVTIPVSLSYFCKDSPLITSLDFTQFTQVTDFSNAMDGCTALTSVVLPDGSLYTGGISFASFLASCESMVNPPVNFEKFDQISSLHSAFSECYKLETITFSASLNQPDVDLVQAFASCYALKSITNLDKFVSVSALQQAFQYCYSIEEINMPPVYTGNTLANTFNSCHSLVFINNLTNYKDITNYHHTFSSCHSLCYAELNSSSAVAVRNTTFASTNPNCLIYVVGGIPPSGWTREGVQAALSGWNIIEQSGTSYGDIKLQDYFTPATASGTRADGKTRPCNYHCPKSFTLKSGAKATYTREFTSNQLATAPTSTAPAKGWQGFVLPFTGIPDGTKIDPCSFLGDYLVAGYQGSNASGVLTFNVLKTETPYNEVINANVPYLILVKGSGSKSITFTSTSNTIPATPVTATVTNYFTGNPSASTLQKTDAAGRYNFYGTFLPVKKSNYYLFNKTDGDYFDKGVKNYTDSGTSTAQPNIMVNNTPGEGAPFRTYFQGVGANALPSLQIYVVGGLLDFNEWIGNNASAPAGKKNYWSQASNWTCNRLPYDYEHVTFRTGAVDLYVDHEIPASVYGTAGLARVCNITGIENKNLRILAGAALDLTENLGGKTTPIYLPTSGKVYVESETRGNSRVNGTLVLPKGATQTATVYFDSKSTNTQTGTNVATEERKWQYFGPPVVESAVRSAVFPTSRAWVRKYAHTVVRPEDDGIYYIYWTELGNNETLTANQGYEISVINGQNSKFEFTGDLVTTDQTTTITYRNADRYKGQWVMSNPFTTGVKFGDIVFTNIEKNVYLFNTGSSVEWKSGGSGGTGTAAGQYQTLPAYTAGQGKVIPSMQGFVVKMNTTTEGATGTIKLPYASSRENSMMKSFPKKDELVYTAIGLFTKDRETLLDEMSIYTVEGTTRGFEDGYDGRKVVSSNDLAWIYATEILPEGNEYMQVDAVPDIDGVQIDFKAQKDISEYALEFLHHHMENKYQRIILVDLQENKEIDITQDGTIYHFKATNETNPEKRFLIKTGDYTSVINPSSDENNVKVYQEDNAIYLVNTGTEDAEVIFFNLTGEKIYQVIVGALSTQNIKQQFNPGVYLVKSGNHTQKIILK